MDTTETENPRAIRISLNPLKEKSNTCTCVTVVVSSTVYIVVCMNTVSVGHNYVYIHSCTRLF